jgi:hypothetical protein
LELALKSSMDANSGEPVGGRQPRYSIRKKSLSASSRKILKEGNPTMSKRKLEWAEKGEAEDFDAAEKFLSLLCSDTKAKALGNSLRGAKLVEHAAKDLLRAAHLPFLPRDESHVDEDLKRIHKGRRSRPFCSLAATLQADFLSLWRTVILGFALSAISTTARPFAAE